MHDLKEKLQTTKLLIQSQGKSLLHPSEGLKQVAPLQLIINSFQSYVKKERLSTHLKSYKILTSLALASSALRDCNTDKARGGGFLTAVTKYLMKKMKMFMTIPKDFHFYFK